MKHFSISSYATAEIKKHIQKNSLFKTYEWNLLERWLFWLAKGWSRLFLLGVFSYGLAISVSEFLFLGELPWASVFRTKLLDDTITTLLGVQAAILGVIYPLVIGLMSIRASQSEYRKSILNIYFADSHIKAVGLSGFYLIIALSIQLLTIDFLAYQTHFTLLILNVFWFLLNIVGSMYFLWVTRLYLNPSLDEEKIKYYIANVGWEYEFGRLIRKGLWLCADNPENRVLVHEEAPNFDISTGVMFSHGSVETIYERNFPRKLRVEDVRVWAAKVIVNDWSRKVPQNADVEDFNKPYLRFNAGIDDDYPSDYYKMRTVPLITQGNAEIRLNLLSRLLSRHVYIFKKKSKITEGHSATDILEETARSVISSINVSNLDGFERDFRQLKSIHGFVLMLSYEDTPSKDYNLLEKLGHDFWRNLSRSYLNHYREIFRFGLYEENHVQRYFESFCYAPVHLLNHTWEVCSHEMRVGFLQLFSSLHFELDRWWQTEVDEKIGTPHDKDNSFRLTGYRGAQQESKLRKLVSAWESISDDVFSFSYGDEKLVGMEVSNRAKITKDFLYYNLRMGLHSVLSGDITSAEWMADTFLRFPERLTYRFEGEDLYEFSGKLVNLSTLSSNNAYDEWSAFFQSTARFERETPSQKSLQRQGFNNLHADMRLIAIVALLHWNIDHKRLSEESLNQHPSFVLIRSLMDIRLKDNTGGIRHGTAPAFKKPADIFSCLVRYFYSGELYEDGSYRVTLDHLLESLEDMTRPEMVSGRGYSMTGRTGLSESVLHIGVVLLSLSPAEEGTKITLVSDEWPKAFPGLKSDRIKRFVNALISMFRDEASQSGISDLYWNLTQTDLPAAKLANLGEALERLVLNQDQHLKQLILDAEIAEERKLQVLSSASSKAFDPQKSDFPVVAFREIKVSDDVGIDRHRKLNFLNYSKGELTEPPYVNLAINEHDYLSQTVSNGVSSQIFAELFNREKAEVFQESSLDEFLGRALSYAESATNPTLLLPVSVPRWLSDWQYAWGENKEKYSVQFVKCRDEYDDTIIGKIQDPDKKHSVTIRQLTGLENPILFDEDQLRKVTFKRFENGLPMTLEFDPQEGDPTIGTLQFTWGYDLDQASIPFVEIQLPRDDGD